MGKANSPNRDCFQPMFARVFIRTNHRASLLLLQKNLRIFNSGKSHIVRIGDHYM